MSRFAATIPAPPPGPADRPGYITPKRTIDRLREERRVRRIARALYDGRWREVLITAAATQFLFRAAPAGDVKERVDIKTIFAHLNIVELCVDMHAEVLMDSDVEAVIPKAFAAQAEAIARIRGACLLDATLIEGARTAYLEGFAALRADLDAAGNAVLVLEDNDVCFPVGPDAPDRQPTVWERRWLIEREHPTKKGEKVRFIRVERHRAGLVEHEAYLSESAEVLQEIEKLKRVAVAEAVGGAGEVPPDRIETGVPFPLVTRIVRKMQRGRPVLLFNEETLSLLDANAAVLSQVCRGHGLHFAARMRVLADMVDKRTGKVDATQEAFIDPNKQVEYIIADLKLEEGLRNWERLLRAGLTQARMAPALVGINPGEGAQTMSAENRRIQATTTLSCAGGAQQQAEPALGRALTVACMLDTRQGLRGYDVADVSAVLKPDIPSDIMDRIERQERMVAAGLQSRRRAVAAIHGEQHADAIVAEIEGDEKAKSDAIAAASFAAVGIGDQASGTGQGGEA